MEFISGTKNFKLEKTCVTLGKFDGIHLGHMRLLNELKRFEAQGFKSVMFTFDLYPCDLFSGGEAYMIYTHNEKRRLLENIGPQVLLSYPFTAETADMLPETFVREVLIGQLDARAVVVGSDFCFGRGRSGNIELLQRLSGKYGYELVVCDKVRQNGKIVSSTLIREVISEGRMEYAGELLGRPYGILGVVAHGRQLGRRLSFPTANIIPPGGKLLPPDGVYFTAGSFCKGENAGVHGVLTDREYIGLCNIGTNPTVSDSHTVKRTVENYFIGESFDVYGMELDLRILHYHRGECRFADISGLKEQIARDVLAARSFFCQ